MMSIPKENVVDLRKEKEEAPQKPVAAPKPNRTRPKPRLTPPKPVNKKTRPAPDEFDEFEVRPEIKITAIAITSIALLGLVAYFAVSKNYLAASFFALAGVILAISIFTKASAKRATPKTKQDKPESLADVLAKIIGL